jgi:hypothetical protein
MSFEPTYLENFEDYLDHEIRTRVTGPIKTHPERAACKMAHYSVTLAIFRGGKEIPGTRESLRGEYADGYQAQNSAFSRGRDLVDRIMAL